MNHIMRSDDPADSCRIKEAYDTHGVPYTLYEGNNRFKGTPVPDGYEATYIPRDDWGIPDSLQLKRKTDEKLHSK